MGFFDSLSGYLNTPQQYDENQQKVQNAQDNLDRTSGKFYRERGDIIKTYMQPSTYDRGNMDKALKAHSGALSEAERKAKEYFDMSMGKGPNLAGKQAIAGAQQAAMAQQAMANSARGGLYSQSAAQQNATALNQQQMQKAQQLSDIYRKQEMEAGRDLYANLSNTIRDSRLGGSSINLGGETGSARNDLTFRGLGDVVDTGYGAMGYGVDATNLSNTEKLGTAVTQGNNAASTMKWKNQKSSMASHPFFKIFGGK